MYYIVFVVGLLLSMVTWKKTAAKIFSIILSVVAALRFGSGADFFSYEFHFARTHPTVIEEMGRNIWRSHEIGFRLVAALFKQLNLPFQAFIAALAIVGIYFIYKTSVKYSDNPTLSLVIFYASYYFMWTFSGLRQSIALTAGLFFLLEAIRDSKTIKFILIVLLLSLFHISALFLLVLYFASKIDFSKKSLLILLASAIVIGMLPWGGVILRLSSFISIPERYMSYFIESQSLNNIFDFQTLGRAVFIVIAFVFYDVYTKEKPENKKIINMYIISFVIYFLLKFSELASARLAIYGKFLDIIILTNIIYMITSKRLKYIYITTLIVLISVYFFKELKSMEMLSGLVNSNPYFTPYVNVFNKDNFTFTKMDWFRQKTLN